VAPVHGRLLSSIIDDHARDRILANRRSRVIVRVIDRESGPLSGREEPRVSGDE
jgi:hypothetical protein